MSAKAVFSAWLADAPPAAVDRAVAQAPHLTDVYADPTALRDGRLTALANGGLSLWSLAHAEAGFRQVWLSPGGQTALTAQAAASGGRLVLNASRLSDLRGAEAGLEKVVQALAHGGVQLKFCLQPEALEPAMGSLLAQAGASIMLCLAAQPAGGPGALLAGLEQRLRPWVEALDPAGLELVLPGHGWAWDPDGAVTPVTWDAWSAGTAAHGPERRDPDSAELHLTVEGRQAWIVDSIGYSAKLWTLRELGLRRFCFSGLGDEDPRLWALVDTLPSPFIP